MFVICVKWEHGRDVRVCRCMGGCGVDTSDGANELWWPAKEFRPCEMRDNGQNRANRGTHWRPVEAGEGLINHVRLDSLWKTPQRKWYTSPRQFRRDNCHKSLLRFPSVWERASSRRRLEHFQFSLTQKRKNSKENSQEMFPGLVCPFVTHLLLSQSFRPNPKRSPMK